MRWPPRSVWATDRYLLSLNWCSSSSSCWLVKAVRGQRGTFPSRLDCAWAGVGEAVRLEQAGASSAPHPAAHALQECCSVFRVSTPLLQGGPGALGCTTSWTQAVWVLSGTKSFHPRQGRGVLSTRLLGLGCVGGSR